MRIRKGDMVHVLTGKDRGKQGHVIDARPNERRVVVENLNIVKRHQRPRPIRDSRGLDTKSFDGRGNYSLGIREQIIFPEIDYDSIDTIRGLDVAITTTAKDDREAEALLRGLGMPFPQQQEAPDEAEGEEE